MSAADSAHALPRRSAWAATTTPRVASALARGEGVRLLRHPVFAAGAALALLLIFTSEAWPNPPYWVVTGQAALPLGIATYVVVWLGARRPERHGASELYRTVPARRAAVTAAHALSLAAAVAAASAVTAVAVVWLAGLRALQVDEHVAIERIPSVAELAQGPAVVLVLGALGLAVARWLPGALGPGVLLLVLWAGTGVGGTVTGCDYTTPTARWFGLYVDYRIQTHPGCAVEGFAVARAAWHGVYVVGVALAALGIALARDRAGRGALALAVGGAATALAAGLLQLR